MSDLQEAIKRVDVDAVAAIVKENPHLLNKRCIFNILPIQYASNIGALPIVELLIQLGGNTDSTTTDLCWTALHSAAQYGHVLVVEVLVRLGNYRIDALDGANNTPLFYAIHCKHASVIEKLVQLGSKALETVDKYDNTLIHRAACKGNVSVLETILRLNPTLIDITTTDGCTSLDVAARFNYKTSANILMALGGKCNIYRNVLSQPSEKECLDIRYRIYFAQSLVSRLLFSIIN